MRRRIPRSAIGPIFLASLLVLLIVGYRPPERPDIAPPSAVPGFLAFEWSPSLGKPRPTPATVAGPAVARGYLQMTTAEQLYAPDDTALLADEVAQALAYTSERFAGQPLDTITVQVEAQDACNLNGIAYTDQRLVQVFTCADLPRARTVNILAHEFVHQLAHDYYGNDHLQADLILAEGLATWGAGRYWLGGHPDFAAFVRHHYPSEDVLLPLATSYVGRPTSDMNKLYYEWASFVEYLLQTYGRNKFDRVYVSGSNDPGSADYAGVYGNDLPTLEQEWLASLELAPLQ